MPSSEASVGGGALPAARYNAPYAQRIGATRWIVANWRSGFERSGHVCEDVTAELDPASWHAKIDYSLTHEAERRPIQQRATAAHAAESRADALFAAGRAREHAGTLNGASPC